jgi:hypothetical protein
MLILLQILMSLNNNFSHSKIRPELHFPVFFSHFSRICLFFMYTGTQSISHFLLEVACNLPNNESWISFHITTHLYVYVFYMHIQCICTLLCLLCYKGFIVSNKTLTSYIDFITLHFHDFIFCFVFNGNSFWTQDLALVCSTTWATLPALVFALVYFWDKLSSIFLYWPLLGIPLTLPPV